MRKCRLQVEACERAGKVGAERDEPRIDTLAGGAVFGLARDLHVHMQTLGKNAV